MRWGFDHVEKLKSSTPGALLEIKCPTLHNINTFSFSLQSIEDNYLSSTVVILLPYVYNVDFYLKLHGFSCNMKKKYYNYIVLYFNSYYTIISIHHTYTRQYKGLLKFTLDIYHNKNYLVVDL